ncbi:capsule assembly Wzi family protein [Nonlabens sp. Hel1_33_55]|uniref:capsule assembly Wzi family protein n=1 Tax=Nonlabens sp. Hel1_33_55 TaxID=1336802 RepID=UPI001E498391|nr:capsule assembly Wzi family protein [Nonlabens sp. Hel1_33_55]
MKMICAVWALFIGGFAFAQSELETFPVFPACDSITTASSLEECFYQELYNSLYDVMQTTAADSTSAKATLRFEVDREGSFNPIIFDAPTASIKESLYTAFGELETIEPAIYNGNPTFMQFIVNLQLPMKENGSFYIFNRNDEQGDSKMQDAGDDIAFAKANNNYSTIQSDKYDGQELRSNAIIPFSYQRYQRYEAAMNRIGNNAHTAVKPYTFNYVSEYFDLEEERNSLLKDAGTWFGRKLWNEHFFEVAGEDYWFVIDPGVDLQIGKDTGEEVNTFNNTRLVALNGGVGKQITFGATIQESQGRFAQYFNREITQRAPDGGNPGIVPGRGIAEDGGENIYDYPVATGYVNYKPSKYFDLQIGHGQHFIGDGHRSLVLSDNSQPFPYVKVNAKFWKIDYTVLYTSLRDVRPEVTADDSFRTKYMTHHYLSWNATKRLTLGFFESVLWQDDNGRGFDFNYLNPLIFYQTVELETGSRGGNALLGVTGKYKITDRLTGYGQLVLDEFSSEAVTSGNGSYQNKSAYQLGLKYQNAFSVPNLMLQAEYNRVRPYTYSHNTIVLNYGNSNQALAHPWGASFYEAIFIARYSKDRWYGIAKAILGERGFDFLANGDNAYYGGNIYRTEDDRIADNGNAVAQGNNAPFYYGELEAGYLINPASNLKVYGQFIYRNISPEIDNAVVQDATTTWFNFGIRTDISNWGFDR